MAAGLHVGNVGSVILLTVVDQAGVVVDMSTATLANALYLRSPANRLLTKTLALVGTGTDGQVKYTTIAGDIDVAGEWRAQVKVIIGPTLFGSAVLVVPVDPNLFP